MTSAEIEALVTSNERLVHYVIRRWGLTPPSGLDYEDLYQEGMLGLFEAATRYDTTKGTKFSTYAVPWVSGRIMQMLKYYSRHSVATTSLDCPISTEDGSGTFIDLLVGDDGSDWADQIDAKDVCARAARMEPLVLCALNGMRQTEIAYMFGLSQSIVSRRIRRALIAAKGGDTQLERVSRLGDQRLQDVPETA